MLTIDHTHVTIPLTFREPGYDPLKDFTPIAGVGQYYNAMAASSKTGIRSLRDLAAWLKANPGQHNFGIPAAGSIPQFAGLIVGHIPVGFGSLTDLIEHHRSGQLRVLAVIRDSGYVLQ